MRYIYGFNPILVQALGYGKQIHNVLNLLHKIAQKTGTVPSEKTAEKILRENFYLRYAAKQQMEKLKKSALQSVLHYLRMWQQDFTLSVKSERSFELDLSNALISGTIDLLKRKDQEITDSILEIIDFKTGNERRIDEELRLQVRLYTIAAREALKLNVEKAYIHFLDDKQRVEILTTPKLLKSARQTVSNAIKGITTRRFNRNPRDIKICRDCDWAKICPKKKR